MRAKCLYSDSSSIPLTLKPATPALDSCTDAHRASHAAAEASVRCWFNSVMSWPTPNTPMTEPSSPLRGVAFSKISRRLPLFVKRGSSKFATSSRGEPCSRSNAPNGQHKARSCATCYAASASSPLGTFSTTTRATDNADLSVKGPAAWQCGALGPVRRTPARRCLLLNAQGSKTST